MVQALRELIEDENYDEASLVGALSLFRCAHGDDDAEDVENFLKRLAVPYEKEGITRTYLMINDEAWERGEVKIDGYFAIALKVLYFQKMSAEFLEAVFGDPDRKNCPAFLIGQLARSADSEKGEGSRYLELALSYISSVSDIIGGRFVYLDCSPARQRYYEQHGFSFLKNKHNSHLIQMYKVI